MIQKEVFAIKFRISLDFDTEETVYMTEKEYDKIPEIDSYHYTKDYDKLIKEYFTRDKIDKLKKELCQKIMNSENPFSIYEVDLDGYPVDEDKIWK